MATSVPSQSSFIRIFSIVWFLGCAKFVLSRDPLEYKILSDCKKHPLNYYILQSWNFKNKMITKLWSFTTRLKQGLSFHVVPARRKRKESKGGLQYQWCSLTLVFKASTTIWDEGKYRDQECRQPVPKGSRAVAVSASAQRQGSIPHCCCRQWELGVLLPTASLAVLVQRLPAMAWKQLCLGSS